VRAARSVSGDDADADRLLNSEPDLSAAVGNQIKPQKERSWRVDEAPSTKHQNDQRDSFPRSHPARPIAGSRARPGCSTTSTRLPGDGDRPREALDATRQSFEEMRSTDNVGELKRIQHDWVTGSLQRLAADMAELGTAAFNLAQTAATQVNRPAGGTAHHLERAATR
jgi:hypothetical protein